MEFKHRETLHRTFDIVVISFEASENNFLVVITLVKAFSWNKLSRSGENHLRGKAEYANLTEE